MPVKVYNLSGIGRVHIYKRSDSRSIRISVTPEGKIRVSQPLWVPYKAGLSFVSTKGEWLIEQQRLKRQTPLSSGTRIGKAHQLVFEQSESQRKVSTRVYANEVRVMHPSAMASDHETVQAAARSASLRALRQQAIHLLPSRLRDLAAKYNFAYGKVNVKQLKSRWGSCDSHGNISLSIYLMQLPWHLIDYVILHELVHTKVMSHGAAFWAEFERCLPNARDLRREIRQFRASIMRSAL